MSNQKNTKEQGGHYIGVITNMSVKPIFGELTGYYCIENSQHKIITVNSEFGSKPAVFKTKIDLDYFLENNIPEKDKERYEPHLIKFSSIFFNNGAYELEYIKPNYRVESEFDIELLPDGVYDLYVLVGDYGKSDTKTSKICIRPEYGYGYAAFKSKAEAEYYIQRAYKQADTCRTSVTTYRPLIKSICRSTKTNTIVYLLSAKPGVIVDTYSTPKAGKKVKAKKKNKK